LRRHDYQTVESVIEQWGRDHQGVLRISAKAPNGFLLGQYRRDVTSSNPYTQTGQAQYAYDGLMDLELTHDFDDIYQQTRVLLYQFVAATLFFFFVMATFLWMNHRREVERQFRLHHAQLAHVARLSTVGEMTSGIIHEINQPIASMVTYAQTGLRMLKTDRPDVQELLHVLEQIASQGLRAGKITSGLKKFTRKGELNQSEVSINAVVRHAAEFLLVEKGAKGVKLNFKLAGNLPNVLVDEIQLEQVILNLMRNSLEAMREADGKAMVLTVETGRFDDESILVSVSDSGPGVGPEVSEEIFDPFFTSKSEGMGMGLTISRSLIDAHGGRLWLDETTHKGATFHLTLPCAPAA
jgi:C4-dicarboxylate-specific signal transduction histidine kinase